MDGSRHLDASPRSHPPWLRWRWQGGPADLTAEGSSGPLDVATELEVKWIPVGEDGHKGDYKRHIKDRSRLTPNPIRNLKIVKRWIISWGQSFNKQRITIRYSSLNRWCRFLFMTQKKVNWFLDSLINKITDLPSQISNHIPSL